MRGESSAAGGPPPAAFRVGDGPLQTIPDRASFLAAARARRANAPGFTLQARDRGDGGPPRTGFTCSKKVGNAVERNRAKRRLREAARLALAPLARPGWDYVLIGRAGATAARPWEDLLADIHGAMTKVHP